MKSQIGDIIERVERGEDIDLEREVFLQALHVVKAGEDLVEETLSIIKGEIDD